MCSAGSTPGASGDRGGAAPGPWSLTPAALPGLSAKGLLLLGSKAAAAAGSASEATSSAARRAGAVCSDTGYCTAAGSGAALSVFWAGETSRLPLKVLFSLMPVSTAQNH